MRAQFLVLVSLFTLSACKKPQLEVGSCDKDLGFVSSTEHLANTRFLQADRSFDWFEIYDNLEARRENTPSPNCIPSPKKESIERAIERREYELKNLR